MTASVPSIPLPNVVLPDPKRHEALQIVLRYDFSRWEREWLATQPKFELRNVRFGHDPDWRDNWLSIQNAHDLKSPVWKIGFGMMTVASFGPAWIALVL